MRWLIALAASAMLLAGAPTAARAHAVLTAAVPADGARLDHLPAEATLSFNEPVTPVAVRVLDPSGRAVTGPDAVSADGGTVRIALPPLDTGTFVISYRVTSGDGHPVAGSVVFAIGAPVSHAPPPDAELPAAAVAMVGVRVLHYASLLGAAGGALFLVLVAGGWSAMGNRLTPGLCLLVAAAAVTGVAGVGLSGVVLEGTPLSGLLEGSAWSVGLTMGGLSAPLALLGLLAVALGLALWGRSAVAGLVMAAGAVAAVASLAATGHATTTAPRWLGVGLVILHVTAAAFWLGSLWPLLAGLMGRPRAEAVRMVRGFSRLAIAAVALLLITGGAISLRQFGPLPASFATPYGGIWLGKMMFVAGMLGAAAYNRLRLTPALERGDPGSGASLRRSIGAEITLGAVILALTVLLGTTPPPRALDAEAPGSAPAAEAHTASVTVQGRTARIHMTPARPGPNQMSVHLTDSAGGPLAVAEARVALSLPSAGVERFERPLTVTGPGIFMLAGLDLPIAGDWLLDLEVLVSDFEKSVFRVELPIGTHRH